MKYFSTFSGIGGFELGIKQAYDNRSNLRHRDKNLRKDLSNIKEQQDRATCVGYSEIDKYAVQVYNKQFNHKQYGDITRIRTKELPNFDLLVGGFPCQAFSIAGKRKGFDDTRGTLFFDLARILADKRPRHFVFENVKGLLSHYSGKTFQTILGVLSDLGYRVEWQVLNSKNFGAPQNRERVFIVGHLGGGSGRKVFPIGEDDKIFSESNKTRKTQSQTSIASTVRTKEGTRSDDNFIIINKKGRQKNKKNASCLTGGGHSGGNHSDMDLIQLNNPTHSNDRVYSEKGLSPTLNTMQGGNRQPFIKAVLTPDRLNKRQNGRRFKENGEPSFTLTGQDKHGIYNGSRIRRLTPIECERLQGFPDNWTAEGIIDVPFHTVGRGITQNYKIVKISDTQRYKMCGNAVTVNVVENVISRLL